MCSTTLFFDSFIWLTAAAAVAVIERTHALRGDNGAIKLRKRALVDLMSELKDSGFSYLAAAVSQVRALSLSQSRIIAAI